jgi:hypothetical protein
MVIHVRAHVRNGRLVVDEPTDLPDGTEIDLAGEPPDVSDVLAGKRQAPAADEPLSPEESEKLRAAASGPRVSHDEVKRKHALRRT